MGVLSAAAANDTYGVILAGFNVVQTIALAYLAARAHQDRPNGRDKNQP